MTAARAPRYLAFGFMALFGLLGSLFVIGEVFTDPGGWTAVLLTAAWLVPAVSLAVLAVRRPVTATRVLVPVAAAVGAFTLADHAFDVVPRDDVGPVAAIVVFATAVVVAFLGLRRALLAGVLLVALAAAQVVGILLGLAVHGADGRPIIGAALGGSSGVVVLPLLTAGILFVVAGMADNERLRHPGTADHTDAPTPVS
jgi:hypothetical protein